jgi:hypothetical protein
MTGLLVLAVDACERLLGRPAQRLSCRDLKALRQLELRGGDRQPVQRRHQRDCVGRAGQLGALQTGQRRRQALGVLDDLRSVEVGLLGEQIFQEQSQRRLRARGRARAVTAFGETISTNRPGAAPAAGEVTIEPVEPRKCAHGRSVLGQARELGLALGDSHFALFCSVGSACRR